MKILWFVNIPFPEVSHFLGLKDVVRGGWLLKLADEIAAIEGNLLGIVWACPKVNRIESFSSPNKTFYILPSRLSYKRSKPRAYWKEMSLCQLIIEEFQPDIIDVHGTENFYGLVGNITDGPVIITLQGLVNEIKKYYWGELKFRQVIQYPAIIKDYYLFCKRCPIESEIINRNKYFIGRTTWDMSCIYALKQSATYFSIGHTLRARFYQAQWDITSIRRHTIYCTSGIRTYKGIDILIKAVRIVRQKYPDVQLKVACEIERNGFDKYLVRLIHDLNLKDSIILLGSLTEAQVVEELKKAHVYAMPSFIENECSSLSEALLVGVPSTAAYTGGVPSTIEDGKTCLMFPRGDYQVMAKNIMDIFNDDALAIHLSHNAREHAAISYDPKGISKDVMNAYQNVYYSHRT